MGGLLLMFVIFIQVVSSVELLAELYTHYVQGCQWRHCFAGEGECCRLGMPRVGGGYRKILLHVYVPLFSASCVTAPRRFHYGCATGVECGTYPATS